LIQIFAQQSNSFTPARDITHERFPEEEWKTVARSRFLARTRVPISAFLPSPTGTTVKAKGAGRHGKKMRSRQGSELVAGG